MRLTPLFPQNQCQNLRFPYNDFRILRSKSPSLTIYLKIKMEVVHKPWGREILNSAKNCRWKLLVKNSDSVDKFSEKSIFGKRQFWDGFSGKKVALIEWIIRVFRPGYEPKELVCPESSSLMIHNQNWYELDNCTDIPPPESILTIIVHNREENQTFGTKLFEKTPYKVIDAAQASHDIIDTNYVFIGKDFRKVVVF